MMSLSGFPNNCHVSVDVPITPCNLLTYETKFLFTYTNDMELQIILITVNPALKGTSV